MGKGDRQPSWQHAVDWAQKEIQQLPRWMQDALEVEEQARNIVPTPSQADPEARSAVKAVNEEKERGNS